MKDMAQGNANIPDDFEMPVSAFDIPRCYAGDLAAVLITDGLIRDRVRRLAKDIHEAIGENQLSLLCVLKGSYKFFNALVEELSNARWSCKEPMTVDFIRCKSYEDDASSGTVQIIGLSNLEELRGKNVLIVDDIIDTGLTLSKLIHTLEGYGKCKKVEDFVAFHIPNKFIVGYGLDYNQKFRDLNHICVMSAAGVEKYKNS
nr:Phosphoribosyltransferase domain containing protein [Haemonchus contortus]